MFEQDPRSPPSYGTRGFLLCLDYTDFGKLDVSLCIGHRIFSCSLIQAVDQRFAFLQQQIRYLIRILGPKSLHCNCRNASHGIVSDLYTLLVVAKEILGAAVMKHSGVSRQEIGLRASEIFAQSNSFLECGDSIAGTT